MGSRTHREEMSIIEYVSDSVTVTRKISFIDVGDLLRVTGPDLVNEYVIAMSQLYMYNYPAGFGAGRIGTLQVLCNDFVVRSREVEFPDQEAIDIFLARSYDDKDVISVLGKLC